MPASRRSRRLLGTLTVAVLAITAAPANAAIVPTTAARDVVLIGNALAGTVSFLDGRTFANLGSLNVIPDLEQRLSAMTVIERAGYELVRSQLGDKFVDDMFLSPDGRTMYVSRANLADVVAIDLVSHQQRWRFKVEGIHADHMAISPDARRIVVSASTGQQAQVLDAVTGALVGSFATGSYPHQNDYSNDGRRIYNSSIGVTSMPQLLEPLKGARQVTVVDSTTLRTVRTYTFDHGIRPSVLTPDEKIMYAQLSYLNGFIEYDMVQGRILRTVQLPFSPQGAAMRPDDYPQNSAHHGLALSGDGGKLCAAGTIDDYVAIISRPGLTTDRLVPVPRQPYWAVTSVDGRHCVVSNSGDDSVSVVSYDTAQEVARVRVGQFPQRERIAAVAGEVLPTLSPAAG